MASKRDQLHAYQFLVQRAVSAMVTRETDPEQPPFRRPGGAAFAGIGIAVVAMAAAGVFGLISPGGNTSWRDGKSVIVEQETGARYVYLDGKLHLAANYASALLAVNQANTQVQRISGNSLAGTPRGPRIGILDAPDALPSPDRMLGGGWTLCSRPATDATGASVDQSNLLIGEEPGGGISAQGKALLVDVPATGERYLIANGYRHRIAAADTVTVGLALGAAPVVQVSPAVIDVLPAGKDIAPIPVPGAGQPSQAVPGRPDIRVGQLVTTSSAGGAVQRYLAGPSRLQQLTELQYDIQRAYRRTADAYGGGQPVDVPITLLAAAESAVLPVPPATGDDPPAVRPQFVDPQRDDATVCLMFDPGSFQPRVSVDPTLPATDTMASTAGHTSGGVALADRIAVTPGSGALVDAMPSADAPAGTVALVTDLGKAYPLGDPKVAATLGYGAVRPVHIPAALLARVPQGPGLNHDAAMQQW